MKIKLFFIIFSIFCIYSCNSKPSKSSWELAEEERAKEKVHEDSVQFALHKQIDDSLLTYDKGLILDSIYLGMPKKDFKYFFNSLKSKVRNKISINGVEFWLSDLNMDFGKDDRLHIFHLEKTYVSEVSINTNDVSKTRVYDESIEIKNNLYKHFSKKYGQPAILKDGKTCHINDADHISWVFSTRRIDIFLEYGNMIILKISDTNYYNRKKEIQDSLDNVYKQSLKKAQDTSEKYGNQI